MHHALDADCEIELAFDRFVIGFQFEADAVLEAALLYFLARAVDLDRRDGTAEPGAADFSDQVERRAAVAAARVEHTRVFGQLQAFEHEIVQDEGAVMAGDRIVHQAMHGHAVVPGIAAHDPVPADPAVEPAVIARDLA